MIWRLVWLAGVGVLAIVAFGCGGNSYTEANKELLGTIPKPPAAEVERQDSSPYYVYETDEVDGYTTNTVYSVSGMTDEEVIQFYIDALGGEWKYCRDETPMIEIVERGQPENTPFGYVLTAAFSRGDASVTLNTDGLAVGDQVAGTYELVVDYDSGKDFCATPE
ncbi:MAG: hypothetical protein WED85_06800 [Dehalococcoidia bacterium]